MSGVIDEDGTQWEKCNGCSGWVRIDLLRYEEPSERYPYGRDLCRYCGPTCRPNVGMTFKIGRS